MSTHSLETIIIYVLIEFLDAFGDCKKILKNNKIYIQLIFTKSLFFARLCDIIAMWDR